MGMNMLSNEVQFTVMELQNSKCPYIVSTDETALRGFLAAKHKLSELDYHINRGKEAEKSVCQ